MMMMHTPRSRTGRPIAVPTAAAELGVLPRSIESWIARGVLRCDEAGLIQEDQLSHLQRRLEDIRRLFGTYGGYTFEAAVRTFHLPELITDTRYLQHQG